MRTALTIALRFLGRVAFATWFGGFTFYAAAVVPHLHDTFGGTETGEISRRVAVPLYAAGLASVALGWILLAVDPAERAGWRGKARAGLLGSSSALLVALIAMHRAMGDRLDSGAGRGDFLPLHEAYLSAFTAQWVANLGLLALDSLKEVSYRVPAEGDSI